MAITDLQAIEIFHLTFLTHLVRKVDKNLFALKGGCNLRFFFKSVRYSEDMDFDLKTTSKETFKKNVWSILESQPFKLALKSKGIEIAHASDPKQTDTTQRWKLSLSVNQTGHQIPTKVEFSRREFSEEAIYEKVDGEITSQYQLTPAFTNHYPGQLATKQKIHALIGRTATQARDIFDLDLLISGKHHAKIRLEKEDLKKAIENALSISYEDYKGQVVAYLMTEQADNFGTKPYWDEMQARVVEALEGLCK